MLRSRLSLIAATLAAAAFAPSCCEAVGFYNMPTSLRQCFGVGVGPGYHADMVLGPCWKAGAVGKHVRYVWNPLPPKPSPSFEAPTMWSPGGDHLGGGMPGYATPALPSYAPAPTPVMQPVLAAPNTAIETIPRPAPMP